MLNSQNGNGRLKISTQAPWESSVGYSRAVRSGSMVFVSGTTAVNEKGEISHPENPREQALCALRNLEKALKAAGAALEDVVQTRIYVADIDEWEEIGKAHAEFFKQIRPATSMVEVSALIHPDMRVEIEAIAIIQENQNSSNGSS